MPSWRVVPPLSPPQADQPGRRRLDGRDLYLGRHGSREPGRVRSPHRRVAPPTIGARSPAPGSAPSDDLSISEMLWPTSAAPTGTTSRTGWTCEIADAAPKGVAHLVGDGEQARSPRVRVEAVSGRRAGQARPRSPDLGLGEAARGAGAALAARQDQAARQGQRPGRRGTAARLGMRTGDPRERDLEERQPRRRRVVAVPVRRGPSSESPAS